MSRIVVIGSINMDLVTNVSNFPQRGETIQCNNFTYFSGGKGANQAVAAAYNGGEVQMIGAVGNDSFAKELVGNLEASHVSTEGILIQEGYSGLAFITVEQSGENQIILAPGSNVKFNYDEIKDKILWGEIGTILLQNEIKWDTTVAVMRAAKEYDVPVWFNPAPAIKIEKELMSYIHTCILNETEIEFITGINIKRVDDSIEAALFMLNLGVKEVIVTLGEKGCVYVSECDKLHIPSFKVNAVDTTAAGDTFIGAYAAATSRRMSKKDALQYAVAASALTVTRPGAQISIPRTDEVEQFILCYKEN